MKIFNQIVSASLALAVALPVTSYARKARPGSGSNKVKAANEKARTAARKAQTLENSGVNSKNEAVWNYFVAEKILTPVEVVAFKELFESFQKYEVKGKDGNAEYQIKKAVTMSFLEVRAAMDLLKGRIALLVDPAVVLENPASKNLSKEIRVTMGQMLKFTAQTITAVKQLDFQNKNSKDMAAEKLLTALFLNTKMIDYLSDVSMGKVAREGDVSKDLLKALSLTKNPQEFWKTLEKKDFSEKLKEEEGEYLYMFFGQQLLYHVSDNHLAFWDFAVRTKIITLKEANEYAKVIKSLKGMEKEYSETYNFFGQQVPSVHIEARVTIYKDIVNDLFKKFVNKGEAEGRQLDQASKDAINGMIVFLVESVKAVEKLDLTTVDGAKKMVYMSEILQTQFNYRSVRHMIEGGPQLKKDVIDFFNMMNENISGSKKYWKAIEKFVTKED